ncbi:SDR family NAD(P)-dependent oxidoreductase [Nonomuraea phyllanthi]|uniref:SDR family NAD(P)-dependent oxidoreductase n=1 Tax=Nonomuraea phyllanthi TaxID=2219224 RepID=A0A5C4W4X5_9ACTN|nr:oxidoreductase [Nonomuraea phyllanthi]KAB8192035.1 SDR family NAD(P)-dependent oxidoreductase [Nonomuraea phyllanthi]
MTPDLTGKTVIVTGANSGIGLATARALAGYGARVVFAVRNTAKGGSAASTAPGLTEVRHLDLADLASIRRFAADWRGPIHLLVNNAGTSAPELERTADGFELHFGTNHLGPFALTNLLLPHVTGRVVSLSSQAERMGRINLDDLNWERTRYRQSGAYATSKLANVLFSSELQRRLNAAGSAVLAVAAHPGFVATNIYDRASGLGTRLMLRLFAQTPEEGALPVLHAATGNVPGDSFIGPEHWLHMRGGAEPIGRSRTAQDTELARRLWDASEKLTGVSFCL